MTENTRNQKQGTSIATSALAAFVVKADRNHAAPPEPVRKISGDEKRKNLSLRLTRAQWLRVSNIAKELDLSVQELALQGLSRAFTDRGLPPLDA